RPCRVALPARAGEVIWQDFGTGSATRPQQAPAHELPPGPATLAPVMPLAEAIARIAAARRSQPDLPRPAPIYLRPADAAPARDGGRVPGAAGRAGELPADPAWGLPAGPHHRRRGRIADAGRRPPGAAPGPGR